jgi:hypothetical protein
MRFEAAVAVIAPPVESEAVTRIDVIGVLIRFCMMEPKLFAVIERSATIDRYKDAPAYWVRSYCRGA